MDNLFTFLNGQANKNVNGQRFIVRERKKLFSTRLHFEIPRETAKIGPAFALLYSASCFNK